MEDEISDVYGSKERKNVNEKGKKERTNHDLWLATSKEKGKESRQVVGNAW